MGRIEKNNSQRLLVCLHCGNKTLMEKVKSHIHRKSEFLYEDETQDGIPYDVYLKHQWEWELYFCPACDNITLLESYWNSQMSSEMEEFEQILYPGHDFSKEAIHLPWNVRKAFEAAMKVKNIDGAICTLSLRRTLEMMCKDKGETGLRDSLYQKLTNLSHANVLPPTIGDIAQFVKNLGNDAAHADNREFPPDLVDSLIEFTKNILEYVYILPVKLQLLREQFEEKAKVHNVSVNGEATQVTS